MSKEHTTALREQIKLRKIAQDNDLASLREVFPDTQSLAASSTPNRYGHSSFLGLMCENSSPEFIENVFETYFQNESPELKHQFLRGTAQDDKRINFHYFAPHLPRSHVEPVAQAYDEPFFSLQEDPEKQARHLKIYEFIKAQHKSLGTVEEPLKRSLMQGEEVPSLELATSDNPRTAGILIRETYPPIYLRQLNEGKIEGSRTVLLDRVSAKDDLVSATYKTDFPEDFVVMVPALDAFQGEYRELLASENHKPLIKKFALDGGKFFFEDGVNDVRGNSFVGNDYIARSSLDEQSITFNSPNYRGGGILSHELSHIADLSNADKISESELMKTAYMLISINPNSHNRAAIKTITEEHYGHEQYFTEGLANIMEIARAGNTTDPLLQSMCKVMGKFADAQAHGNTAVIDSIMQFSSQVPGMQEILKAYEEYIPHQSNYQAARIKEDAEATSVAKVKKYAGWKSFAEEFSRSAPRTGEGSTIEVDFINELRSLEKTIDGMVATHPTKSNMSTPRKEKNSR